MPETDLFLIFAHRFHILGVPYMVTGSVAGVFYGEPRVTHDVDVVLRLRNQDVDSFHAMFPLEEFYCPPKDVLRDELQRTQRGHFNLIHHKSGFRADVYCAGRDPFHEWALARRREIPVDEVPVPLAPLEYVIVRKLEFFREGHSEKHLKDIRAMLRVSGQLLDREELTRWVEHLGLETELRRVETEE
ncbi:MAG: hypothetical protein AAGE52_38490 [Myxococcota bacterium]